MPEHGPDGLELRDAVRLDELELAAQVAWTQLDQTEQERREHVVHRERCAAHTRLTEHVPRVADAAQLATRAQNGGGEGARQGA